MYQLLQRTLNAALSLPCAACGATSRGGSSPLCAGCWTAVFVEAEPKPLYLSFSRPGWSWLPFGVPAVRQSLAALKFKGHADLALILGSAMAEALPRPECTDMLVPIPLHPLRAYTRGYNQAERIAAGMSRVWNIPVARGALVRPATAGRLWVPKQSDQQGTTRVQIYGAYDIPEPSAWNGAHIALVDDTVTTGSTLNAAAEVCIKKAKVAGVIPLTLAYASLRGT